MKKIKKFNFWHLFLFAALISVIMTLLVNISPILSNRVNYNLIKADLLFFMGLSVFVLYVLAIFLVAMKKIEFKGITKKT
ncbi:MAG TPA: hypothetical protein P5060_01070 [Candidatus Absconditabacterales bacterium]|nr:hypothetical protein [Candidatus Absconditabacterales bacterium]